jgi:hypothetical protein
MNPRVLLIGFVGVAMVATISFVVATNDERVADASGETVVDVPAGESASVASEDDGHGHNAFAESQENNPDHAAENQPDQPLDPATRQQLSTELMAARDVALRYPTVADAEAAGYYRAGRFVPGAGAHYVAGANGLSGEGPIVVDKPMALIYDGISPTSQIVGLMYYAFGGEQGPEGFAGPNDHWHRHRGICIKGGTAGTLDIPLPVDSDATQKECDAAGGRLIEETAWMLHAWVVPSWESPAGVFSHDNPNLHCADGTDDTDEIGFCEGT